jgi:uncharacterized protein (TIGR00251 family)
MIAIIEKAEGCILPVRAQPGARKNVVVGEHGGALKIAVTAPPQNGRANTALIEVLFKTLKLKRSQVQLAGGETSRDKRFLILGLTKEALERQVSSLFRK